MLLLWLCGCWLTGSGQVPSFQGKLIYTFHNRYFDAELSRKYEALTGTDPLRDMTGIREEVLVNDAALASVRRKPDGDLHFKEMIDGTRAIIVFAAGDTIHYYGSVIRPLELQLVRKTGKTRTIAGHPCRKFEYRSDQGTTRVVAWIAQDIPYDPTLGLHELPFFRHIFFEEGLVLEKTLLHEKVENHWVIESILPGKVSDQAIRDFFHRSFPNRP